MASKKSKTSLKKDVRATKKFGKEKKSGVGIVNTARVVEGTGKQDYRPVGKYKNQLQVIGDSLFAAGFNYVKDKTQHHKFKHTTRLERNRKELIKQILEEAEEDPKIEMNDEELEKRINERIQKSKRIRVQPTAKKIMDADKGEGKNIYEVSFHDEGIYENSKENMSEMTTEFWKANDIDHLHIQISEDDWDDENILNFDSESDLLESRRTNVMVKDDNGEIVSVRGRKKGDPKRKGYKLEEIQKGSKRKIINPHIKPKQENKESL